MGIMSAIFGSSAEKYDPNSDQAKAARTLGGPNHAFDTAAAQSGRTASSAGSQLDTTNYNQDRQNQGGVLSQLAGQAQGQGPSAAGMTGAAQRDSNLTQAAALQSGRRGQSAGAGIRAAGNQVVAGNQQAAQTEAIGRANEMNAARGQQVGLLGQMAGQDTAIAGQNAQLGQANNQFNAGATNQAAQFNAGLRQSNAQANQQAQLGIANTELQARQREEAESYSNLNPGSQGLFSPQNVATGITAGAMAMSDRHSKEDVRRVDGSQGRAFSPRNAKTDIQPATMGLPQLGGGSYQQGGSPGVLSPGSRVMPNWNGNSSAAYGDALGKGLSNVLLAKATDSADVKKKGSEDDAKYNAMLKRNGGYTDDQLQSDPSAIRNHAAWQRSLSDAAGDGRPSPAPGMMSQMVPGVPVDPNTGLMFSDGRSKEDVRPVSRGDAREMLDEAPAYNYFYKPDAREAGAPEGRQTSLMWDDLQKTRAGRQMDGGREESTGYHTVDYLKGLPAAFAALSDVNARLSRIEGRK